MNIGNLVRTIMRLKPSRHSFFQQVLLEVNEHESVVRVAGVTCFANSFKKNHLRFLESFLERVHFREIQADIDGIAESSCAVKRLFGVIEITNLAITVAQIVVG